MRAVRARSLPMVVDADGLWLVNQDPSLVAGEPWMLLLLRGAWTAPAQPGHG